MVAGLVGCRVCAVPGRGLGITATRSLTFGAVVCVAPALVSGTETVEATLREIVHAQLGTDPEAERLLRVCWEFCGGEDEAREDGSPSDHGQDDSYAALLRELPTEEARQALRERGLANASDVRRLAIKLSRNGFAEGVFPDACRFNHACLPNCLFFTRAVAGRVELVVVAAEAISAGMELTICYLPEARWHLPTDQRRLLLERQYAFRCTCRRCHRPAQTPAVRRSERALEAMWCVTCVGADSKLCRTTAAAAKTPSAGEPVPLGAHVPLDEHEDESGERAGGYTPCARCGAEADEAALDRALITCHARVIAAARAGADGGLDAEYDALCELLEEEGRTLCPTHWLALEMRWRLQATSAMLLAPAQASLGSSRLKLLKEHALHSLALLRATEPIAGARSHLSAALCARAAHALDALAAVTYWTADSTMAASSVATGVGAADVAAIACADVPALQLRAEQLRDAAAPVLSLVGGLTESMCDGQCNGLLRAHSIDGQYL